MDIYYTDRANSDKVTVIKNGVGIFYSLFKPDYKTARAASFETASPSNRLVFFQIMQFFVTPGEVNEIDLDLLYTIREVQLNTRIGNTVQHLRSNVWDVLKSFKIPIYNKEAFAKYVILPLCYCDIRFSDFKRLWMGYLLKKITSRNYERRLKSVYTVLSTLKRTNLSFNNETTVVQVFDSYLKDPSILDTVVQVMKAYHDNCTGIRASAYNAGFPTIDRLVKNIVNCEDSEVRSKMVSNYINACKHLDVTLTMADANSSLPSAWQVAMKTKNSILNVIPWNDLNDVVSVLYYKYPYLDENGCESHEPIYGPTFRRKVRNKGIDEFLRMLYGRFKFVTKQELSVETLKARYNDLCALLTNDRPISISRYKLENCGEILDKFC